MLTGRHWVRDVSCKRCNTKLGWMYELAAEDDQRYKEAKVILEKALVREKDGIQEHPFASDLLPTMHPCPAKGGSPRISGTVNLIML